MKLSEVFSHLAYGELSQVVFGENIEGEIRDDRIPGLVSHINMGLLSLYRRFYLKEGIIQFEFSDVGNTYVLQATDINKIEKVTTAEGYELSLNDYSDMYSCITPTLQSIIVPQCIIDRSVDLPTELVTDSLIIIYRARHPIIGAGVDFFIPDNIELELPYTHLQALLYFVASRVYNPIGMVNEFHSGNTWFAKYEQECKWLEIQGMQVNIGQQRSLVNKGFV